MAKIVNPDRQNCGTCAFRKDYMDADEILRSICDHGDAEEYGEEIFRYNFCSLWERRQKDGKF